jgi:hypothetical protein
MLQCNRELCKPTGGRKDYPTCPYGDLRVVERRPWIALPSIVPLGTNNVSDLWGFDIVTSATVSASASEMSLSLTASTASSIVLQTKLRGIVVPGLGAECAIGIRLASATLAANQIARWGCFDGTDGFYYQVLASTFSVCMLRDGTATVVPQSAFNIDTLDGTGPSGLTLDLTSGNVFRIVWTPWYTSACFVLVTVDGAGAQVCVPMHQMAVTGATPPHPEQPIRVQLTNNGLAASTASMFVAGRTYSLLGSPMAPLPTSRVTACTLPYAGTGLSLTNNGAFIRVMAVRKKAATTSTIVVLDSLDLVTASGTLGAVVRVATNATVTVGTWSAPTSGTASETVLEMAVNSTLAANALTAATAGTGTTVNILTAPPSSAAMIGRALTPVPLHEQEVAFVEARLIGGTTATTIHSCTLHLREFW